MPRFWPRTLLGRNLILLVSLAITVHVSSMLVFDFMQRPRVIELGVLVASQLNLLDEITSKVDPAQREICIDRINRSGQMKILRGDPPAEEPRPRSLLAALFFDSIRKNVKPDIAIRWRNQPHPQLLANIHVGGEHYWLASRVGPPLQWRVAASRVMISVLITLLAMLGAFLIQQRLSRPLRDIAAAARKVRDGARPERLGNYSTCELADVAEQFNMMMASLEEMESTRAVMLAGISHDLRTPLTKLRLALAMDGHVGEETYVRYIDQIDAIISQFIDYMRDNHSEAPVEGDLNALILQLADLFSESGHAFQLNLGDLPLFRFRPVAMSRVVTNLMDNACKYGGAGLEVKTWCTHGLAYLAVLDRGPGLPLHQDPRYLIRPFVRADVGRSSAAGTGLGLAIVDRLVRIHGGSFQLKNRHGGGTQALLVLKSGCAAVGRAGPLQPIETNL
ncbi:two-component sensor histidine kinase [Dyella flagellata]|uniref:histidine kinase n=2 Tax=Dyella flagellata TaxID=1867833 RepID=A0ABQ5XA98_9GAMM|nr:two-component sensor histidine kinase [Dyella flagellata]